MGQILEFIRQGETFNPEDLEALGKAYEMALAALHDVGQPEVGQQHQQKSGEMPQAHHPAQLQQQPETDPAKEA